MLSGFAVPHGANQKIVKFHNRELYDRAVASGHGVLLLLPHFGNWEMIGLWCGDQAKTTAMYRKPKMEDLDPLIRKIRESAELSTLVPANARGVMAVLKALKRGEQTIVLPDQVPAGEGGLYSSFFGIPAYTQTLAFNLIQKTGSVALFGYALRVPGGFELGFMDPLQKSTMRMRRSQSTLSIGEWNNFASWS
ncbi:MAG: lysophospholipid acyltransferase family protein [Porticoccaceae bacterium]